MFRVVSDTAAIFVCLWYRVFCVISVVVVVDVDVVGCSVNNMNIIRAFHDRLISLYQHRIHWHAIKMCNGYFMGLLQSECNRHTLRNAIARTNVIALTLRKTQQHFANT